MRTARLVLSASALPVLIALAGAPTSASQPVVDTVLVSSPEDVTGSEPPEGVTAEQQAEWAAVDDYVLSIMNRFGNQVWSSVDWSDGVISFRVNANSLPDLASLQQNRVGRFIIAVAPAIVTFPQFERAIHLVTDSGILGSRLDSFSLPADSSRVVVAVERFSNFNAAEKTSLTAAVTAVAQVPVQLEEAEPLVDASRKDYAAPMWGGASMYHYIDYNSHPFCSTGFSVLDGGYGRLLSAAHCDGASGPHWAWTDLARDTMLTTGGAAVRDVGKPLDSMLIDPVGGTEGRVFGGRWDQPGGTPRWQLQVNGADSSYISQRVCTSGAMSGEHCGLRVYAAAHRQCGNDICHRWKARPTTSEYATALTKGDSGGPVYSDLGHDRVGARGIISEGGGYVECGRSNALYGVQCLHTVLFVGIKDINNYSNVKIETAS